MFRQKITWIGSMGLRIRSYSVQRKQFNIESNYFDNLQVDQNFIDELKQLNAIRKSKGCIQILQRLFNEYSNESDTTKKNLLKSKVIKEIKKFPNKTHPDVEKYGVEADPVELYSNGDLHQHPIPDGKSYSELCTLSNTFRMSTLGNFTGPRSYYFMHSVAKLEQALIRYTTDILLKEGFELIAVPDILPAELIEACGMAIDGDHQVYRVHPSNLCLSGTSEMALAGYLSGQTIPAKDMPKKLMAVSRCFRAEADSRARDEGNLYRVHYFTKVEMFAACHPNQSNHLLEEFRSIQCRLFEGIGLCFKLYDMPIHDLGAPAYRKYDIEAWIPSQNSFGEISSTSNCTDYQSKRLNIYCQDDETKVLAHTVNGTACAIPRMIIAILEQYQTSRSVLVPEALQPYMGEKELRTSNAVPRICLSKMKGEHESNEEIESKKTKKGRKTEKSKKDDESKQLTK